MTLSQKILSRVEKKLCQAFKEILESREHSRKFLNSFAVKQNARKIKDQSLLEKYKALNSSYRIIEHNLSLGKRHPSLNPLVHSTFSREQSSRMVR